MWKVVAVPSHRHPLACRYLPTLSSQYTVINNTLQLRYQSSQENPPKELFEQIFESIEQQAMEDEASRKPDPWFSLLHYPSRAAWRASDHSLGNKVNNQKDDSDDAVGNNNGKSPLKQTQFNLLRESERTNKQLRRTYKRISETHKQLAIKRERERRMAANLAGPPKIIEQAPDGTIEDDKGREVGSWHEKKSNSAIPTYYGCDDPSVLLALSMGMAKSDTKMGKVSKLTSTNMKETAVGYGSEQVMTNVKFRFEPQYAIARRVLLEVQSLLGGTPVDTDAKKKTFQPKRVLDFGSGIGSSAAAALDVFGVKRSGSEENPAADGIDWVHSIDASQSMREATEKVLKSILESHPWESEQQKQRDDDDALSEDIADSERILRQIKGEIDERGKERRRKRHAKWEQNWTKQTNYRTRLTFGESIVDSASFYSNRLERDDRPSLPWQRELDEQRQRAKQKKAQTSQKGSFDLILCNYTLSEMSNVPSSLAAAALLWEKLAPNGVMVFVEPGTPDGFSTLRSVRSMLLECCPPRELKERRKQAQQHFSDDDEIDMDVDWEEECHVIAPCTHNAACPMSRHQRNHVKRNTRFGKYKNDSSPEGEENKSMFEPNLLDDDSDNDAHEELGISESESEAALRELLGDGNDISEEDLQSMLDIIESMEDDGEDLSDEDDGDESDEEEFDGEDFYDIDERSPSSIKATTTQTNVFDTSFCSFVQNFPGGTSRRRGEKFSYLVVQKRIASEEVDRQEEEEEDALKQTDVVDLLAQSVHHAQKQKTEYLKKRLSKDFDNSGTESSYHEDRSLQILQQAVDLEDKYLDSADDDLGLEMLHREERRKGWGRLIRAPLKRKGHILLDYCSGGGCGDSCSKNGNANDGKGRIIRQKVSRGWSARVAPGCYSAARKARWGGLWPDLSDRTKEVAKKESMKDRK